MSSSVDHNRKFSERTFSTLAIFEATSKLFSSQGCSDDKTVSTFPEFSSTFLDFAIQFCFRCKFCFRLVCHFFVLTTSVWTLSEIYYWTDARQHGIYLLNSQSSRENATPSSGTSLLASQIALFFYGRGHEGRRAQSPKASTICSLFSILLKTDPKLSLTRLWETLFLTAVFVCCQRNI